MRKVRFFIQRHGAHTEGELNEEGRQQVARSAKKHMAGLTFHHVMSGEMLRARETVIVAAHTIGCDFEQPIIDPGFGFSYTQDLPLEKETPYKSFLEWVSQYRSQGHVVSVNDTFEHWKPAQVVACVLNNTMRLRAQQISSSTAGSSDIGVLVGSHGTCSLAALNRATTEGAPNNGDIMVYTWQIIEGGIAKLSESRYLATPSS